MAIGRTRQLSISPGMSPEMLRLISEQRGINKDFDRRKPITAPTVFNNNSMRPAARDNPGRVIFVRQASGALQGQYSDGSVWQTFLATSVSFATPAITYGTSAAAGSATTTIRSDATLKYPIALMSAANSSTLTLTDDATDQTLTGSLGALNLRSANSTLSLDTWTGGGQNPGTVGRVLSFNARTANVGTTLTQGLFAQVAYDVAATYTGITHRSGEFNITQTSTAPTYTTETAQVLRLSYTTGSMGANAYTWTEIGLLSGGMACPSGASTVITDVYGVRISGWPTVGTFGTITNAYGARFQMPTIGDTIRRGVWVDPSSTTDPGAEAANVEGFYCGALPRGTAQRVSYYALGATTGTPTMVAAFYAAAHGVGTTKWSYYANDESRMNGVQQDDNAKDVYGTGRDATVYYDGTDLIVDPDVVGTGVLNILGGLRCDSIQNDTGLASGVYTPTRSAEANLDANVTMTEAQYLRVGNTVTVSGRFTADPTLTATTTSFEITLPVASNIGAAEDVAGTAFCGAIAAQGAEIIGVAANDTAKVQWKAGDITSQTWSFVFTYQVI